ncbi:MAG: glycosyltransferase family 2 protein [Deltaproteobacteria bacterium]|nr:glycosyltransferase family 2 protein [Candidatus Zymogenaceae bacterium]
MSPDAVSLSVVVPLFNEQDVIEKLYEEIARAVEPMKRTWEIVFINDGSTDDTLNRVLDVAGRDDRVVVVDLMGNFGQTAALSAGFDCARGDIIVAMDGDLQDDPSYIPRLVSKLEEGYDIVSGWRKKRKESFLIRRIPSMTANWMLKRISGIDIHDFGTTFKAYRASVVKNVKMYGDFHRFIPALAREMRVRVTEVEVAHHKREYGESKYGIGRTFVVFFDLFRLKFILDYLSKPLQVFGAGGLGLAVIGFILFLYVAFSKFYLGIPIEEKHGPLFITSIMFIVSGVNLFTTGLLGEMILRNLYESGDKKSYYIREIHGTSRESNNSKTLMKTR